MNRIFRTTSGALAVGMMAAACSTSPPPNPEIANTAMNNAAQAVDRAAADPKVAKYAPDELQVAQGSLNQAHVMWQKEHNVPATSHQAYLAHQRAETAIQLANQRAAEDAVKLASAEQIHVQARAHANTASVAKGDQKLQQELAGLPAHVSQRGIIVTLPQERFAFDNSALPADTTPMIEHLASVLKENPERKVAIEGYTDNEGDKSYNKMLGRDRAGVVRAALIRAGIDPSRIIVRSYGDDFPIASNDDSAGRKENRRAEILISDAEGRLMEPESSSGSSSGQ